MIIVCIGICIRGVFNLNNEEYLINFLEKENTPIIKKKKHMYLAYRGLEQAYTYVLIDGVVKTSIIMNDGREFNLDYVTPVDIVSLVRDEVSNYTSAPFNVRIESDEATFYRIPRIKFWQYVKNDQQLQDYVREYYRNKLSETIESLQYMTMNGKKGAVCSFLYKLVNQFGVEAEGGILIDFNVTNEDIAGFCGISTRNSVNRIIHDLKEEGVVKIHNQKLVVLDKAYLEEFTGRESF